mgnify:CR=1 FL=1|jgi:colanic acid biosynthesis glycosyl transferase WcaI
MIGVVLGSMTAKSETKKPIRVLAIHRYYWPDTPPYASILKSIVSRWSAEGHDVEVFSTQPNYKQHTNISIQPKKEIVDGVRINRMRLPKEKVGGILTKMLNLVRFIFGIFFFIIKSPRFDIIMASTAPPVFVGAAARWGAKLTGAKFVYHCMDLHPEIGRLSGEFKNKYLYKILLRIDANNCKKSNVVVVLSNDMKKVVLARPGCSASNVVILNNFSLPNHDLQPDVVKITEWEKGDGVFRLIFAGNIGGFQGLENFVNAMHLLTDYKNIELAFVGEGKAMSDLKVKAGKLLGSTIQFIPHQPVDVARLLMQNADLGIISLTPKIINYAYPSKTMVYLDEGLPIIAAIEKDCELCSFLERNTIGVCVSERTPQAIADCIRRIAHTLEYDKMVDAVNTETVKKTFCVDKALNRWSELITDITNDNK